MAKVQTDQFANQAVITLTESAANTLTFKKLETGVSLFEKVAWLISRIEYFFTPGDFSYFNGTGDALTVALTTTSSITSLPITDATVLDIFQLTRLDFGTAANAIMTELLRYKDLSALAGGGLLVPPNPIYGAIQGSGLSTAATVYLKIFYTVITLEPAQYWELVEARRIIAS